MTTDTKRPRKRRERELEEAHQALMDWAQWWLRNVERSPIGHPSSTIEGKIARGWLTGDMNPYRGSIAPNVAMSPYIRAVDRAVREMSQELRAVVEVRYELTNPEPHDGRKRHETSDLQCRRRLGLTEREWAARLDRVLAWVAAYRKVLREAA